MPKSDAFFIRETLNIGKSSTFVEQQMDIGFVVDALNETVMRVHNIAVAYTDSNGTTIHIDDDTTAAAQFQLTTQSQGAMVFLSDKAVIASGNLIGSGDGFIVGGDHIPTYLHNEFDLSPQHWDNGYLVGVEAIYLGGEASVDWTEDVYVSVVLECTAEKLTKGAAMALALSQQ